MRRLLEIVYFGYGILLLAAALNLAGRYLGMKSWYDVLGAVSLRDLGLANMLWLVAVYPCLLGTGVYLLNRYKPKIME